MKYILGFCMGVMALFIGVLMFITDAVDNIIPIGCTTDRGTLSDTVPAPLNGIFTEAAEYYDLDPPAVAIIYFAENYDADVPWREPPPPYADGPAWPVSPDGASGPMQFMPGTWAAYRNSNPSNPDGDILDLKDAVYAGAHYLKDLGATRGMPFGSADDPYQDGTMAKVMGSYNAGPGGDFFNQETQAYIRKSKAEYELLTTDSAPTDTSTVIEAGFTVQDPGIMVGPGIINFCGPGGGADNGPGNGNESDPVTTTLPDCPYTGPPGSSRGDQPGLIILREFLQTTFNSAGGGIFSCRQTASGTMSLHAEGRAHDAGFDSGNPTGDANGTAAFEWAIQNAAAIGAQEIIWKHQIWTPSRGLHEFTRSDHFDHVHIGLNWPGALGQTSFFGNPI